ncbi:hypothetical protein KSP40_PGU021255 [Platanthera guangdongensis]|uniref:NADH dehydrogenase subunit 6 n=1 Tax=Platanthera guangdongensis TaxID=2320717 RepID=A0ABR2LMA2_9ASPA
MSGSSSWTQSGLLRFVFSLSPLSIVNSLYGFVWQTEPSRTKSNHCPPIRRLDTALSLLHAEIAGSPLVFHILFYFRFSFEAFTSKSLQFIDKCGSVTSQSSSALRIPRGHGPRPAAGSAPSSNNSAYAAKFPTAVCLSATHQRLTESSIDMHNPAICKTNKYPAHESLTLSSVSVAASIFALAATMQARIVVKEGSSPVKLDSIQLKDWI